MSDVVIAFVDEINEVNQLKIEILIDNLKI
jgi:hypothetical protein